MQLLPLYSPYLFSMLLNYEIVDNKKPDGILQLNSSFNYWITAIRFGELLIADKFVVNGKLICN